MKKEKKHTYHERYEQEAQAHKEALLKIFSNPSIVIRTLHVEREMMTGWDSMGWPEYRPTGIINMEITLYDKDNDSTKSETTSGKAKRAKHTDRTVPKFPSDRVTG